MDVKLACQQTSLRYNILELRNSCCSCLKLLDPSPGYASHSPTNHNEHTMIQHSTKLCKLVYYWVSVSGSNPSTTMNREGSGFGAAYADNTCVYASLHFKGHCRSRLDLMMSRLPLAVACLRGKPVSQQASSIIVG